jgi:hypothetical protein
MAKAKFSGKNQPIFPSESKMSTKLSKKSLQAAIQLRIDCIQSTCGFDPGNGASQIPAIASRSIGDLTQTTLLYGEFVSLRDLALEFGLNISILPENFKAESIHYKGQLFLHFIPRDSNG